MDSYVGGKRHYGGFQAPVPRLKIGGFQAPPPELIVAGKKKLKFRRRKGTTVALVKDITSQLVNEMGTRDESLSQMRHKLAKERAIFKSTMNKAATALKKSELQKGNQNAIEEAERLKTLIKEDLKRLLAASTLDTLRKFNARIKM